MKRMKLIKNRGIASVTAFSLALALTVTSVLGSILGTWTVRAAGGTDVYKRQDIHRAAD